MNAHNFSFTGMDGNPLPLARFVGQPVLIVNTASACGLTPQYAGLEKLHEMYGPRGLILIGVPCNDFGAQEPGTEAEIKSFCETQFGVTFTLTRKEKVLGETAHPFYRWTRETLGADAAPKWNFHKYLIDGAGRVIFFSARTEPLAHELTSAIEERLPKTTAKASK